jgi:predicted SAM-dependent methyltransferase
MGDGRTGEENLKLNLGCGKDIQEGYVNIDISVDYAFDELVKQMDIRRLEYPDNSADEIRAIDVIEHIEFWELRALLHEWWRVLKPGGKLTIRTDNFEFIAKSFLNGELGIEELQFFIHNSNPLQTTAPDAHRSALTEPYMKKILALEGLKVTKYDEEAHHMIFECEKMTIEERHEERTK